jgi:hypothetical protein
MEELTNQVKVLCALSIDQANYQKNQGRIGLLINLILKSSEATPEMIAVAQAAREHNKAVLMARNPGGPYVQQDALKHPQAERAILQGAYLDFLKSIGENDDYSPESLPKPMD